MMRWWRIGEFAGLAGVTVRTLHYYDQIGLLRPDRYSTGGQRLYGEGSLLRMQQILTLRYLRFPLNQIAELLDRPDFDLAGSMRIQRLALRDRISELEQVEAALRELLEHRNGTGEWEWDLVASAMDAVQSREQRKGKPMEEYYSSEQLRRFAELRENTPEEEIQAIEQGWSELLAEIRANRDLDPGSAEADALAARWNELSERTQKGYEGNEDLWEAIGEHYEQANFASHPEAPSSEDFAFIQKVNATQE